jgi:LysM repeat protein
MAARNRARYLAPIALAATIAGTYVVVSSTLHPSRTAHSQSVGTKSQQRGPKFYVVKPGDNLTSIAARTVIPVTTLEDLNRRVDPNALQAGQRLRLRR